MQTKFRRQTKLCGKTEQKARPIKENTAGFPNFKNTVQSVIGIGNNIA